MNRPQPDEYAPYYAPYIEKIEDEVFVVLDEQLTSVVNFLKEIPEDKHNYAYAPGKWTIKEIMGHVIDTERIMSYRLLRFSRKDSTGLAGFDENSYILNSSYQERSFLSLIEEFQTVRKSHLFIFNALTPAQLELRGAANGSEVSVRALLFIIAGHLQHHMEVIKTRYLA